MGLSHHRILRREVLAALFQHEAETGGHGFGLTAHELAERLDATVPAVLAALFVMCDRTVKHEGVKPDASTMTWKLL
jgi:hypothetical protein